MHSPISPHTTQPYSHSHSMPYSTQIEHTNQLQNALTSHQYSPQIPEISTPPNMLVIDSFDSYCAIPVHTILSNKPTAVIEKT